jgi:hypothetical protein
MCGKLNPPEAEVCQFCQARLKPLRIQQTPAEEVPATPKEKPTPKGRAVEEPPQDDWLRDFRPDEGSQESKPEESQVDWLGGENAEAEEPASSGEGETRLTPDWLSRIDSGEGAGESHPPAESSRAFSETKETAGDLSSEKPSGGEEIPDWLAELDSEGETPASSAEEEGAPSTSGEGTGSEDADWLQRIRVRQQFEEQLAKEAASFQKGELPTGEEEPSEQAESPRPVSEWLSEQMPSEAGEADTTREASTLPDWSTQEEAEPTEAGAKPEEPLPEWLSSFSQPETMAAEEGEAQLPEKTVEAGEPEELVEAEAETTPGIEEGTPDWLSRLEASATEKPVTSSVPAFIMDEEEALQPTEGEVEQEPVDTSFLSTLPEWISQVSEESPAGGTTPPGETGEAGLERAELPTWLEAMRPIEAAAPSEPIDEELAARVERVGPLAGMRGALPAETAFTETRKPSTYSIKLQIAENQQAHIALLEKVLATEGESRPLPVRPVITPSYVVRLFIAAFLLLVVLVVGWVGKGSVALPAAGTVPAEIIDTRTQVEQLIANAPVLLAFDYEPGFAGELDAVAGAVIRHLIVRNAHLTMVSTSPTGPLLAERLLSNLNKTREPDYLAYANLGYIPGGPTGLVAFAENPRRIVPVDLGTVSNPSHPSAWFSLPLQGINSVADFAMVAILTENPDTARAWIEQVQPYLRKRSTPMILVTSAQTEMMIRPYYEASPKQVSGYVSGLAGGAAYETLAGQSNLATGNWDAFGAGLVAVVVIIAAGSVINLFMASFAPPKPTKEEEVA